METTPLTAPVPQPVPAPAPVPAPSPAPAATAATFGTLFKRALQIWKKQWWKMAILGLLPLSIGALAGALAPQLPKSGPAMYAIGAALLVSLPLLLWLNARIGAMQVRLAMGADAALGLGDAWTGTKGLAWSFFWAGLLTAWTTTGGMLIVIPGILWALSFIFVPLVVVKEGQRGLGALVYSRQLVKGHVGWVFWKTLVFGFAMMLMSLPFAIFKRTDVGSALSALAGAVFFGPLSVGFLTAMFESISALKGGRLEPMPRAKTTYAVAAVFGVLSLLALVAGLAAISMFFRKNAGAIQPSALTAPTQIAADAPSAQESEPAAQAVASTDADGDGLSDAIEASLGTAPERSDTDGDGLNDTDEAFWFLTSPTLADTDGDGHPDSAELLGGYSPRRAGEALTQREKDAIAGYFSDHALREPTVSTLAAIDASEPDTGFSTTDSRDAKRLADVHYVRETLKRGYDATGAYPVSSGVPLGSPAALSICLENDQVGLRNFDDVLDCPETLQHLLNMGKWGYFYASDGTAYAITFTLEDSAPKDTFSEAPPEGFKAGTYCANQAAIVAGSSC